MLVGAVLISVCLFGLSRLGWGLQNFKARDELTKGVQAFKIGAYPVAVEHFKLAVSLDPTNPTSRAYLATSYMMQYIPGAESEENLRMAEAAHSEFLAVLELDPKNTNAMAAIAQLYFNEKRFDDAADWYKKLIAANANDKTAYYTLGVIAWMKTFKPRMLARAELGMRPEDPGPIRDKKVRGQLRTQNMPIIEEGMQALEKAIALDREYEDATAYLNLLYRERADLSDTVEGYKKDTAEADAWVDKTLYIKKVKASRMPLGASEAPLSTSSSSAVQGLSANWLLADQAEGHRRTIEAFTSARDRGDLTAAVRILRLRSSELARAIDKVETGGYSMSDKQKMLNVLEQEKGWADSSAAALSR